MVVPTRPDQIEAELCALCGKPSGKISVRRTEGPVCSVCYTRHYCSVKCDTCGQPTRTYLGETPALCRRCAPPKQQCLRCKKPVGRRSKVVPGGRVCTYCRRYFEPPKPCDLCGVQTRHIRSLYKGQLHLSVCTRCANEKTRETCSVCRKYRVPERRTAEGKALCLHCASGVPFVCPLCKSEGVRHSAHLCRVCYLRDAIRRRQDELRVELMSGWGRELYDRFFAAWLDTHHLEGGWRSTLRRHLEFFKRLERVFNSKEHLTTAGLLLHFDAEALRRANVPFRWLVDAGVVPGVSREDAEVASETLAQTKILARANGWKLQLLERFHTGLLRRKESYRKRGWSRDHVKFKDRTITVALRAAFKFLDFLPSDVGSPQAIGQLTVDRFLARFPGQRSSLMAFLIHLNAHEKLFNALRSSNSPPRDVPYHLLLSWERAEELIERWLAPEQANPRKALLGVLLLLYARSAYQACSLRRADFSYLRDGGVQARFGAVPVRLDSRTAALVRATISALEAKRGRVLDDDDFIFPGRSPGRPLSPASVDYMLQSDSLKSSQLYSTGLAAWYEKGLEFPKVLSKTLGITVQTAIKYWKAFSPRIVEELQQRAGTR